MKNPYRSVHCCELTKQRIGYPELYETGKLITGLDSVDDVKVFHAGTKIDGGLMYSNGGRVLNICAVGNDLYSARAKVYSAISKISFENAQFRKDIAVEK